MLAPWPALAATIARDSNDLQQNSLRSGTGNFSEQNRELELPNRKLFAPISELKPRGLIEEFFAERLPQQDAAALLRGKAEHLVLAEPFGWQVGETGNSHAMREPPVDGGLDEIGREEGKRDCHSHLADAAPVSLGDAVRGCGLLGDKFIEPTAPAGDRCDQGGAIFRTYRPGLLRRHSIGDKNRTVPP